MPNTLGCGHCTPMSTLNTYSLLGTDTPVTERPGYVILDAVDRHGPYLFIGRCFYCNHRDR